MDVRILVTDHLHKVFHELAKRCGIRVDERLGATRDELLRLVPGYDVLVVRSRTRVDGEIIAAGRKGRLRLIVRAGVGLDNIDLEAAKRYEVEVVNTPTASTQSVAELVLGLMIAAARSIAWLNYRARNGVWLKERGLELYGKTLLVVGFGRIGRRVAAMAKALGMRVKAYDVIDIERSARSLGVEPVYDLCEALRSADVVSVHVPLTKQTYHLFSDKLFECMKPRTIFINTSRGAVVDAEALLRALEEGKVYAAGLDVLEHEPPATPAEKKLLEHPRVIVTPHIGASTEEAQYRVAILSLAAITRRLGICCPEAEEAIKPVCDQLEEMGLNC
ncbi:D-2-hydroxyacid dehydrogenase [Pyrofollis japonicus]|uniref:D-2-hydroxyacid dehydrogenase n=1 Tax=Pyrofollis japonicus TaxID=3060460 RepID=UPI00295B4845|nr:D-2-hydroxyacid dehydrogenase [Pyrofollis japonicus]BEP17426.1 D-2-hydroxyacid dehydrogenase [Pyrofollis japonicus]